MMIFNKAMAIFTNNCWNMHNAKLSKAVERLSSGLRINRAADDPAGLAMAQRMKAQLTSLERQNENTAAAADAVNIADGAAGVMQDILRRMTDLSAQAASGTMSDEDRKLMDIEYQELLKEIDSIGERTNYNGINLFEERKRMDGWLTMDMGGTAGGAAMDAGAVLRPDKVLIGKDGLPAGMDGAGLSGINDVTLTGVNLTDYLDALDDFMLTWSGSSGDVRSAVLDFTRDYAKTSGSKESVGYTIQVKDGNVVVKREGYSSSKLGLGGTNLLTQEGAQHAMDAVKKAVTTVAQQRAAFGAEQSRLSHRAGSLTAMELGLTDAYSRIMDADMAKEMMNYAREQMLAQVSGIMMTHIKTDAYQVLSLLP